MGGTFDPIHIGHLLLGQWAKEIFDLDELWLLVSPNNPLKSAKILAPEQQRLEGVRQAIKDIPGLVASDFEFSLPRPSYTANTLRELQRAYPEHEFTLIIGEDNIAIFDQWREYEYIASNFRIFVYPRKGSSMIEDCRLKIKDFRSLVYLKGAPTFDISSSAIRHSQGLE